MEKGDYSLLAVSICKSREERMRECKDNAATILAKKMVKKIASILRSRSRYSRRKSTLVFNYSAYPKFESESQCCTHEPRPRFCPDLSASSRQYL